MLSTLLLMMGATLPQIQEMLLKKDKHQPGDDVANLEIDIGCLPLDNKYKVRLRKPSNPKPFIVLHITSVRGGFGLQKSQVKKWRNLLDNPIWPQSLVPLYEQLKPIIETSDKEWLSARLCVWERYRKTPYHMLIDYQGNIIWNVDLHLRSAHAGEGNDGFGFAIDCGINEPLEDKVIEGAQEGLIRLQSKLIELYNASSTELTAHRCFASDREVDPGAYVWRNVVCPLPEQNKSVSFDYFRGSGQPINQTWDPRSPYKGK